MFGSILKMLFSYKIFTFSQLFSQHPNKFYYRKYQNHSQIPIHRTNHSQIPTPHTTGTPIQPTIANSGNQKPQPPKHHYHTTTTTTKIKITERERERDQWVEDRWVEGEIARRRDRRWDRATRCDQHGATIDKTSAIWCMWSSDWSSGFAGDVKGVIWAPSSSSRSFSLSRSGNHLKWK